MKSKRPESFWKKHVGQFFESGLNQAQYCRKHQLNPKTFYGWVRKFKQQEKPENSFIPIKPNGFSFKINNELEVSFSEAPNPHWMAQFVKSIGDAHAQC